MSDAQEQFESIEQAQRRVRQGKETRKIIDSIEKSKQRDRNARKKIRKPGDAKDEVD